MPFGAQKNRFLHTMLRNVIGRKDKDLWVLWKHNRKNRVVGLKQVREHTFYVTMELICQECL